MEVGNRCWLLLLSFETKKIETRECIIIGFIKDMRVMMVEVNGLNLFIMCYLLFWCFFDVNLYQYLKFNEANTENQFLFRILSLHAKCKTVIDSCEQWTNHSKQEYSPADKAAKTLSLFEKENSLRFWRVNWNLQVHNYVPAQLTKDKLLLHNVDTLTKIDIKFDKSELPTSYRLPKLHKILRNHASY